MTRANRHFIPGYIWHLTHRCHKRQFLLKFATDRSRWLQLLFEARKRYGVSILNYTVTSNHIHLIVTDNGRPESIPRTMQYVAGKTGQEYNRRKKRRGAFWQDRYHATAIESGAHLRQCLVYVDLNMVRAGVVNHPAQWNWNGFNEIQNPKRRYRIIDHHRLQRLLNVDTHSDFTKVYRHWAESQLTVDQTRKDHFSRSLAVGSEVFISTVKQALGVRAKGRKLSPSPDGGHHLREPAPVYAGSCDMLKKVYAEDIESCNEILWDIGLS